MERYEHPPGRARGATYTTEMWLHAALVYLHVAAWGPRSTAPRLRRYVARSLDAYLNLPRRNDIHIALPFGVCASMAGSDEAVQFLRVADLWRELAELNPGQRKTFRVLKECWRLRECVERSSPTAGVTWRDGAQSLRLFVLPV